MSKALYNQRSVLFAYTGLLDAKIFVDLTGMDETDFESSILRNLHESDAVLVIVTELTFAADRIHHDNDWVRREIREALTLKKPMVLACVDGLFPPGDLPDDIQAVRGKEGIRFFQEYFEGGVQRLASFITRATPIRARTSVPNTSAPPLPKPTATGGQRTLDEAEAMVNDERFSSLDILPKPFSWIDIPSGKVTLVPDDNDKKLSYLKQKTAFDVPAFAISTEITLGVIGWRALDPGFWFSGF